MKIALIGYGKMGKTIHEIVKEKNERAGKTVVEIVLIVDIDNRATVTKEELQQADVAIEFTSPHTAVENIKWCFEANVPIVVGSTGWTEKLDEIKKYALDNNKSFLFAPNFSIGVNIFFEVNRYLAQIMNQHQEYEVIMEEIHHTEKKDSPSGTALHAALDILKRIERKASWKNEQENTADVLSIISKREENVPGTHTVTYESSIDKIELTHLAHNRKGFAGGAVLAAEWLKDKKGAFSMEDVLGFNK
ncbi:MAG TPA: 4-hydroxy-tetrahydrodipicolinate reductase [Chitinophagales bacterium]|jgi:4-hydroxy-tetrahydrodipicolinate reductase|nr:4-hydroxy-tetrahydrodipicolinate reductase [Chitinophagales bacterium]